MLQQFRAFQTVEKRRDRKILQNFSCFVYCKTPKNSHLGASKLLLLGILRASPHLFFGSLIYLSTH